MHCMRASLPQSHITKKIPNILTGLLYQALLPNPHANGYGCSS